MTTAKEIEAAAPAAVEEAPADPAPADESAIERLLDHVPAPAPAAAAAPAGLRTARVVAVRGKEIEIAFRGRGAPVVAQIDDSVDRELVLRAMAGNEAVLVEHDPEVGPVIVGVVQTRLPDVVEIKARKIAIDAEEELLLRAGRGAMRIREDGDVELVGSRISTMSRGLFRIVGRVLRLN